MASGSKQLITRLRFWLISHSGLTDFEKRVLVEVSMLERGTCVTYGEIAKRIGRPRAYRAVGNALHKNPFPLIVPCHRVVGGGGVGGYSLGIAFKRVLLLLEGSAA